MTASERGQAGTWRYLGWWTASGDLDLAATLRGLPCDDLHAAHLIDTDIWPGELHHASELGQWHVWDGRCHRPDDSALIDRRINEFTRWAELTMAEARRAVSAHVLAANQGADQQALHRAMKAAWEPWQAAEKYAAGLRRTAGLNALRSRLAGVCGVAESWLADKYPELLNCRNGIVDLRTGALYPHDPRAMMTYCIGIDYNPQARSPWYDHLMSTACGWSAPVTEYLWRVLGYCLIGDNREQKIFFLEGETGSGKSQLLDAVTTTMGTLAHRSQNSLICVTKQGRNARVEWSCRGARLVTITETSGHNITDEAQVKRLTGESWISVDRHYSLTEVKIPVTFTIVQATNEMQTLTNFDAAMRRRTEVLPMGKEVPEAERITALGQLIAGKEPEGILASLIAGAMAYFRDGLHPPAEVVTATAKYEAEQNTLEDFLADTCEFTPEGAPDSNGHRPWTGQSAIWRAYIEHARGGPRLRKHQFFEQLRNHPGVTYNEGSRRFEGIKLTSPLADDGLPGYTANQYPEGGWGK